MIERLALSWKGVPFAAIAALAWASVWLASWPQITVKFLPKADVEVAVETPSQGSIMGSIEDDDRESEMDDDREPREDDREPSGLPGVRFVLATSLTHSQITSPQSVSRSVLTRAVHPLRC